MIIFLKIFSLILTLLGLIIIYFKIKIEDEKYIIVKLAIYYFLGAGYLDYGKIVVPFGPLAVIYLLVAKKQIKS